MLPYWHGIFKIVERTRASDQNPKEPIRSSEIEGAQNKERVGCSRVQGSRSRALSNGLLSVAYPPTRFQVRTGSVCQSPAFPRKSMCCVESRRVELRSVALKSVCRQVCNSVSPVQSPPRLALAHVFACLKAAAAKSTSSRLLGRTALPASSSSPRVGPVASRGLSSVSARLSVSPSVSKSASVRVSVAYPRLN